MITFKENNKNIEEFNLLYDSVGWGVYDEKVSKNIVLYVTCSSIHLDMERV